MVTPLERESWLHAASRDERRFLDAFEALGLGEGAVKEDLERYRAEVLPATRAGDAPGAVARLRRILQRRELRYTETDRGAVEIPLFKLHAPDVPDTKVTYEETSTIVEGGGWSIKLFGMGMGDDQTVAVQYTNTVACKSGVYELILVKVPVCAWKVEVIEKGKTVGHGYRVEVDRRLHAHGFPRKVRRLSPAQLRSDTQAALEAEVFSLEDADPTTAASYRYRWEATEDTECRLGVRLFNTDLHIKASVGLRREVVLTYDLRGGHTYHLLRLPTEHGIVWMTQAPGHSMASAAY